MTRLTQRCSVCMCVCVCVCVCVSGSQEPHCTQLVARLQRLVPAGCILSSLKPNKWNEIRLHTHTDTHITQTSTATTTTTITTAATAHTWTHTHTHTSSWLSHVWRQAAAEVSRPSLFSVFPHLPVVSETPLLSHVNTHVHCPEPLRLKCSFCYFPLN